MPWAPQLVVQMPKEPQVPVQKVMMPVVQKVLGPGFQLQNINSIIIWVALLIKSFYCDKKYVRCTHQNETIIISKQNHLQGVAGAPNGVAGACPNMSY